MDCAMLDQQVNGKDAEVGKVNHVIVGVVEYLDVAVVEYHFVDFASTRKDMQQWTMR